MSISNIFQGGAQAIFQSGAQAITNFAPRVYNLAIPLVCLGAGVFAGNVLFDYIDPKSTLANIATTVSCIGVGILVTGVCIAATHPFTPINVAVMSSAVVYEKLVTAFLITAFSRPTVMFYLMV